MDSSVLEPSTVAIPSGSELKGFLEMFACASAKLLGGALESLGADLDPFLLLLTPSPAAAPSGGGVDFCLWSFEGVTFKASVLCDFTALT